MANVLVRVQHCWNKRCLEGRGCSLFAFLTHMTVDHIYLPRQSAVHTPRSGTPKRSGFLYAPVLFMKVASLQFSPSCVAFSMGPLFLVNFALYDCIGLASFILPTTPGQQIALSFSSAPFVAYPFLLGGTPPASLVVFCWQRPSHRKDKPAFLFCLLSWS